MDLAQGVPRLRKCPQCRELRPPEFFKSNKRHAMCQVCTTRLRLPRSLRSKKEWRSKTPRNEELRVRLVMESSNVKTGPMPVTTSSPSTCPKSCGWYGQGCYAEYHFIGHYWRLVPKQGLTWEDFCARVAALPEGTLWRHNEAGDLPGRNEDVDPILLRQLVQANTGRRGFTYTHKKTPLALKLAWFATVRGFTVNISCDTLEEVDALYGSGPCTVTIPSYERRSTFLTKAGHRVTICPAQLKEGVTCQSCKLCAVGHRKTVVAFRAHGQQSAGMDERLVQLGLPV